MEHSRSLVSQTSRAALPCTVAVWIAGCAHTGDPPRFGLMLVQTVAMLVLVSGLAVVTLRAAARLGVGRPTRPAAGARLELVDELVIGPRQSIVALRAGGRILVAARTPNGFSPLGDMSVRDWERDPDSASLDDPGDPDVATDDTLDSPDAHRPSDRARSFAELLG